MWVDMSKFLTIETSLITIRRTRLVSQISKIRLPDGVIGAKSNMIVEFTLNTRETFQKRLLNVTRIYRNRTILLIRDSLIPDLIRPELQGSNRKLSQCMVDYSQKLSSCLFFSTEDQLGREKLDTENNIVVVRDSELHRSMSISP